MKGYITMINKDLDSLQVLQKVIGRQLMRREAAMQLNLSKRQIKRLCKILKEKGSKGLISQKRGKPSSQRIPNHLRDNVLSLIYERYSDFGPTLAHEKLTEAHHIELSVSTVRNIMVENGIWISKKLEKSVFFSIDREDRAKEN